MVSAVGIEEGEVGADYLHAEGTAGGEIDYGWKEGGEAEEHGGAVGAAEWA